MKKYFIFANLTVYKFAILKIAIKSFRDFKDSL